jgi:hypothetical protein
MPNLQQIALNLLQRNPNVVNNPRAQSMLQVIQQNDTQQGEQIARNLCATMGVTPEQATQQAKTFFHIA